MHIGIFTDSFKPYTSGVVTSICTFREELEKRGHSIFVFAPSYPDYRDDDPNVHRFMSVPAPGHPDFTLAIPISPRIYAIARKMNLDVVHVHSPFILGRLGAKVARRFDLPLVFTYHTMYDQYVHYVPVAQELARDITIRYSRHFCNQCDLVIAPSVEVQDMIYQHDVRTPVEVLPTGVPVRLFARGDASWLRRRYGIPDDYKICLFVGRLTREKNIDFLIQAFARVKARFPASCLVIVATGPLEEELKAQVVQSGMTLDRDVIFTGFLSQQNLVDAYHGADLFTFASVTETQGIVLIEAMAAGCPAVAVRASGVQEMVDHGVDGFLTEYDMDDFVNHIVHVLSDDGERARLKEGALAKAASMSSEAMALRLERKYQELVDLYRSSAGMNIG